MRTLLLSLLLAAAAAAQAPANVLLIVADDLGVDYVGCYGEGTNPPPTPNIDALASGGVLFRNAWANPSCSPTRACFLTGRYPFRTLVGRWIAHFQNPQNVGLLRGAEFTLPEVLDLAGSGYAHAMVGKWHLHDSFAPADNPRTIGGFSHFAGFLEGQVPSYTDWTRVVDGVPGQTTAYCTIQNTDDALAWIQAQAGPWVCVLTYHAPHIPYHAPPAHLHTQNLTGLVPQPLTHTPANIPFYRAMVQSLDTEMGRLFSTLGSSVMDDTNVIFMADNGSVQQQSVAPFSGTKSKGTPYEGGVNVPLIVKGPIVQQPGREVTALACAVDMFSTVLELTGSTSAIPPFVHHDSVSIVPYLTNPTQAPVRQFAYTEEFTGTAWPAPNTNGHATIRNSRYKLIRRYNGSQNEVYDLQNDPWETTNLRTSPNQQVQANYAALLAEIDNLRSGGGKDNFAVFGNSTCASSVGVPTISASGNPTLGNAFTVRMQGGLPLGLVLFVFGTSWTTWNGLPLPLSLSVVGAHPDCLLSSSGDILLLAGSALDGSAQYVVPVPVDLTLVDTTVCTAWVVLDAAAPNNPAGFVSTNSLATTMGL
jgi:arylsulfatase A-like enzyme